MEEQEVRDRIDRAVDRMWRNARRDPSRRRRDVSRAAKALRACGGRVAAPEDPGYPDGLRDLPKPPILFLRGPWDADRRPIAIVGSRDASPEGLWIARHLARGLAEQGAAVVSGMARGIDGAAHEEALHAGGSSGAVLGTSLTKCYPPEHRELQERLAQSLGLMTDVVPGFSSYRGAFLARNRLLAAISRAVVVVEAGERSGTLSTVAAALELRRPLVAPPWPVWARGGRTPNHLIHSGRATLVRSAEDILERMGDLALSSPGAPVRRRSSTAALPERETRVLKALHEFPRSIEEIAGETGLSIAELGSTLIALELSGWAARDPGGAIRRLGFR